MFEERRGSLSINYESPWLWLREIPRHNHVALAQHSLRAESWERLDYLSLFSVFAMTKQVKNITENQISFSTLCLKFITISFQFSASPISLMAWGALIAQKTRHHRMTTSDKAANEKQQRTSDFSFRYPSEMFLYRFRSRKCENHFELFIVKFCDFADVILSQDRWLSDLSRWNISSRCFINCSAFQKQWLKVFQHKDSYLMIRK